jgi:hypothetical protein
MVMFLRKLVLFLLLFWAANSIVAVLIAPRARLNLHDKYHWVMSRRSEHYHTALVGSSRVENCIDAREFERVTGNSCINLGIGGAGAVDQYLLLHEFLRKNTVDEVLLQLDYLTLMDYFTYGFRDYEWLCYDDNDVVKKVLIKEQGLTRYFFLKVAPFVRLMEFSSQYRYFLTEAPPDHTVWDDTRGTRLLDSGGQPDTRFARFRVDTHSMEYLKRTLQLCRQRGIRVIAFQTPYPAIIETLTDRSLSDVAISRFCAEEGLQFHDFSRTYYDRPELFCDRHHLNSIGSIAFSRLLGETMKWAEDTN